MYFIINEHIIFLIFMLCAFSFMAYTHIHTDGRLVSFLLYALIWVIWLLPFHVINVFEQYPVSVSIIIISTFPPSYHFPVPHFGLYSNGRISNIGLWYQKIIKNLDIDIITHVLSKYCSKGLYQFIVFPLVHGNTSFAIFLANISEFSDQQLYFCQIWRYHTCKLMS